VKVAVTGASGFVGRYVVAELARRSIDVLLVVRPGATVDAADRRMEIVPIDFAAPPANAFARICRPDIVVHLAWGGLPNYLSLHHFERELPAQFRLLRTLVDGGLQNLLVTGTCFEYGMQSGPLGEELPAEPANPYAYAKVALHTQLRYLQGRSPFNLTWARLFYLYGDGQAPTSLWPQLRAAIARGDAVFPMSGGEQLRDYLPVAEAGRLLVDLAVLRRDAGVVNVCSGVPTSVRRLVETWVSEQGIPIELELGKYPYPAYEPMAFWGRRDKLITLTGTHHDPI
jgi:nucleoside-diphosphate-sugar epimerase